jgi:hypothetical protein
LQDVATNPKTMVVIYINFFIFLNLLLTQRRTF